MTEGSYEGIAVIGMTGRFPGAEGVEELWANLVAGKEGISFFGDAELAETGLDAAALSSRGRYIPARGILKDADCFDAAFFGIHPREAEVMDPQHRLFLESCWAALERAGYAPNKIRATVGIFAGATFNTYYLHALHQRQDLIELVGPELVMFGNEKDYLTTRVAYKLGLKGPAVNVSTACSTSLVAVTQACQSLLTYQCDMALAGGSSVTVPQRRGYFHDEGNIGSADGHTRSFDVQSSGTAFSNGVAVVVLKRLADAVSDGDRIYATIKAAALNNDGSQRLSFGAPGVEGQSEVIAMAHALAGIDPETITYVEAHGTATPLGDPIEVAGLTKAFRVGTQAKQFCALGSVKTNLGHLDAAAGVTGLIKVALSLHHKIIPASLHFTKPNPKLDLENTPFYVNATLQEWKTKPGVPRRAGVSAFGTGGTNAHVVLEEAPEFAPSGPSRPWQLLLLSAKTPEALDRATANLSAHLRQIESCRDVCEAARALADTAFTLQTGRGEFVHRRIVACRDAADGATALESGDAKRVFTHQQQLKEPPVVFMFPGQGAQYAGMGAEVYRSEPTFRAEVDRCAELLQPVLEADLRTLLFPAEGAETEAGDLLMQTRFTQPALFTIEYALAKLWMSWGIRPAAMIGHSVGEYVAGCLAGVFSLEDALALVARRGALVQAQPGGAMLAVRLPEKEVAPLLHGQMAIAAINSPSLCVVASSHHAIAALEAQLTTQGVVTRHLHTSHAFHSPMMDPVLAPFTELLNKVKLGEPKIPYVSNVSGQWITSAETRSADYWASHVRDTVRFADGIAELMKDPRNVLWEVGPGQTLSTLARQHPSKTAGQVVLSSLPLAGDEEPRGMLEALGRLWMAGAEVDWHGFYANERRRPAVLPSYPFERKRYWPEPAAAGAQPQTTTMSAIGEIQTVPDVQAPAAAPSPMPDSRAPAETAIPRRERLRADACSLLQELSGYDLSGVDPSTDLLELGLDSLLLTQAATLFQRKFGVRITFRQLMEELSSLDAIALHLDAQLPPEAFAPAAAPAPQAVSTTAPAAGGQPNTVFEQLLQQQQQLTNQLLEFMGKQPVAAPVVVAAPAAPAVWTAPKSEGRSHGPFKPMDRSAASALSPVQSHALDTLIDRYTGRTPGSKKIAGENRPVLADPRSAAGFKQAWKEMVYPIVTTRSDGSKVWDVDGNEYVDFVMGFGASLFGHRPPFVIQALREQLEQGFEIGPIQPLAGEVAALITEFNGMERVAFTNTGSEAVLAATRVSRTVTGRDKIAVFAGAYHGIFDEVLFRPVTRDGEPRAAALAPGVPETALGQVIVLDYGNPQSLDYLRARGSEIAAVLVEPVQSRRLELQPKEFLHELRRVTEQTGSALIFDEVVTGFRVHPGGAQSYFGVRADLATYGKVIGGGLPIGVVTGAAKFMDALDGGKWQYGDTSFPEVGVTFFAGTFVRHPLALAAAKAVLTHLKEKGPELQERLNERTAQLAVELQAILNEFDAPYHLTQFSSLMHLVYPGDQKFAGLLFYLLRERGIHIWDNRTFVMTTAHREEDLRTLTRAFRESLAEMRSGEFLLPDPEPSPGASRPRTESKKEEKGVGAFPLTEAQKEIWLAAQMGGDAAVAYNESLKFDFRGAFDVDLFRAAAHQVVQRHPILLGSLSEDGEWQRLNPDAELDMPLFDLSRENETEREQNLTEIVDRETSEAFDLVAGPLLRVRMVRMAPEHHVVIWTAHHVVCDGWSGGLIISELAKIYSALKEGKQPDLEKPERFEEYALITQGDSAETREALEYWRQQFVELPPALDLPTDHRRAPVRTARASTAKRGLDPSVQQALKRTAGQQRTTMVVLLMAALQTLLHRLTGQIDLVVGLGVAGQAVTGKNCLVGHCVNLVPIRTRLKPEANFQENLAAVKKSVLDAYEHHQTTIGTILQHLHVPRNPSRPPLVEVIFNVDRDPGTAEFHGVRFTCERNSKRALHYDLFFNFVEGPQGLYVECDYNADLFEAATIDRWLGHYDTILASIVANPSESMAKLPILTEAERRELTVEWNRTGLELPPARTLHALFERQAEKTPNAQAVTFEDSHLTYDQLNRRANQLARHLQTLGAGPDVIIGLCVDRSIDMVVAVLAILKAGGAYLPLDFAYPKDRLAFMLEDTKAPILLTQRRLLDHLPQHQANVVCIDEIQGDSDANLAPTATGSSLAYVIYTSGSTGKPKGVLLEHQNAVNLICSILRGPGFTERDVMLSVTTVSFDIATAELFLPLASGGRLIVASNDVASDGARLLDLLNRSGATFMQPTPVTWQMLLEAGWQGSPQLKMISTGEPLTPELAARLLPMGASLWNLYGPTETTIWSTGCQVTGTSDPIAIGRPVANTQTYILDVHLQPTPVGVTGELFIGGDGLARGYLNRPELTAEKFVPNPFAAEGSSPKLYRTGDHARYRAVGSIESLGRNDHQVKLRGFRIELGEIEAILRRHEGVGQCVVVARENLAGEKMLVAYFEPQGGSGPAASELRTHLKKELPDYMIPSAFVVMEKFPLTPNGKIDRKALPPPEGRSAEIQDEYVAPRDPVEQGLALLWSKVLKVGRVGLNDNFFELGGHSILAVRIVVEIEKLYKTRLPLATLLQAPTVGELAQVLRNENWQPAWSSLVPVRPGGSKPPLFLMHSHGGNVLEYYPLVSHLDADQPVFALQARGLDGHIVKGQSLEEMVAAYLTEVRSLQPAGPYFLGGFCFGGLLALEAARQLTSAGEEVALVAMIQTMCPVAARFCPTTSRLQRWWYQTTKRIDLERENLSDRGNGYFFQRSRRIWDVAWARFAIALDKLTANGNHRRKDPAMAYIFEALGVEHDKVFEQYQPRSYDGDVLLVRASKQLRGLVDRYLGWKDLLPGNLDVCEVPGHQQNILMEPKVGLLAEELTARLQAAQQRYLREMSRTNLGAA